MKAIAAIALAVAMTACAAPRQQDPRAVEFREWTRQQAPLVRSGQIKYSEYYTEAYNRLAAIQTPDPGKLIVQKGYADLIPVARAYESGQISKDQFDDARRATELSVAQQGLQNAQAAAQAENARRLAVSAALQQAQDNLRAMQQPMPLPSMPVQTNCYRSGNYVNCTTR